MAKSNKMLGHKDDNFTQVQEYRKWKSVDQSRIAFRIRSETVDEVRGNFKDKWKRKGGEAALACQECPSGLMETQSHCVTCPKWQDIRMGLDMNKIEDLVTFFQRFLTEKVKCRTGSQGAAQQVSSV